VAGQGLPGVKSMAEVAMCERLIGMSLLCGCNWKPAAAGNWQQLFMICF